jgi:hypothetical protein
MQSFGIRVARRIEKGWRPRGAIRIDERPGPHAKA